MSIAECPYPEVDDPLSSPAQSPSINSVPPSAMAAAAAAAGVDAVSSISGLDADDGSILGPPTFGSSFVSDDDPYAWAQKLRRIPDKVCRTAACEIVYRCSVVCVCVCVCGCATH